MSSHGFLAAHVIQITVVTAILLAMYWPLVLSLLISIVPIGATVLHFQHSTPGCRGCAQDSRVRRDAREESLSACGGQVVRRRTTSTTGSTNSSPTLRHAGPSCHCVGEFWTLLEIIPNLT